MKLLGKRLTLTQWDVVPTAGLIDVGQEVEILIQQIFTYYTPDTRLEHVRGKASALTNAYLLLGGGRQITVQYLMS